MFGNHLGHLVVPQGDHLVGCHQQLSRLIRQGDAKDFARIDGLDRQATLRAEHSDLNAGLPGLSTEF